MKKKPKEERPFPWLIKDFEPVTVEDHPRGLILTNAEGVQILRTNPGRVMVNGHYHRVPSQDYIVHKKTNAKIKDSRTIR